MAERKIKQWITVNGVHVPIYEGESKADGVKRAIEKAKSNAKTNEDQKAKDIAKNKAQKDELNGKSDTKTLGEVQTNDDHKWVVDKLDGDRISAQLYEKVNGKWTKLGGPEKWADRKEFEDEYGKIKETKSDNKPTADDIKKAYKDAWDKKGDYSKIEQLKKESGLSQRELAGIKNDANDEYAKAKSGKAVDEVKENNISKGDRLKNTYGLSNNDLKKLNNGEYIQAKKGTMDEYGWKEKPTLYMDKNGKVYESYKQSDKDKINLNKENIVKSDKDALSNADSGKAVDEVKNSKSYYQRDPYTGRRITIVKNGVATKDHWYQDYAGNRHHVSKGETYNSDGVPTKVAADIARVPASFAANYPNLSSGQLKKKYEEYLKKNRK